jgi:hypothetical protein
MKQFDCMLCADTGTGALSFKEPVVLGDVYTFVYQLCPDFRFGHAPGDFVFLYRDGLEWQNNAYMVVGNTKNDSLNFANLPEEKKRILYIDSGHMPFGREGKEQIVDMLLQVARENPDYELIIKPRWLRGGIGHMTHAAYLHLYDLLEARAGDNFPRNLNMLNEHQDLHELIASSHSVICLTTSAIIDVLTHRKGLCIATDYPFSETFDHRQTEFDKQTAYYCQSGCGVPLSDIPKYMPDGIKSDGKYLDEVLPKLTGASARAADVMEYVYENYLKHGKHPEIREYSYDDYKITMAESRLTFDDIKQLRFQNYIKYCLKLEREQVDANIDFSHIIEFAETEYKNYPFTRTGISNLISRYKMLWYKTMLDNSAELTDSPNNHALLLQAMFEQGYDEELISMEDAKILALGPWHYYVGRIYSEQGDYDSAVVHYAEFLKIAANREYAKYRIESPGSRDLGLAYEQFSDFYNRENIPPEDVVLIVVRAFQLNLMSKIKRAQSSRLEQHLQYALPLASLSESGNDVYAIAAQIVAKSYSYSRSTASKLLLIIKRLFSGGIQCVRDHGVVYTFLLSLKKIGGKLKQAAANIPGRKLWQSFKANVLYGYSIYSRIARSRAMPGNIFLALPGVGDAYNLARRFKSYTKDVENPIFTCFGYGGLEASKLFGIDDPEVLQYAEFVNLVRLLMFSENCGLRIKKLHSLLVAEHTGIFKHFFGLWIQSGIRYIDYLAYGDSPELVYEKPMFKNESVVELFKERCLVPYKTVIVAPYAKSVKRLPMSFWSLLVDTLNGLGYTVATNINKNNPNERPLGNTNPLSIPLSELVPAIEYAGCIIGLRSGLLDVAESANALKISLCKQFDTFNWGTGNRYLSDVWSLSAAYDSPNIYDLVYRQRNDYALVKQIVKLVQENV